MEKAYQIEFRSTPISKSQAFPSGQEVHFPFVIVDLRYGGAKVRCNSVIDSGAHFSIFPLSIGRKLGLEVERGKQASIQNTNEVAYFWEVEAILENTIEFPLYAGFSQYAEQHKVGLLGQIGFFDKFIVSFDQPNGKIVLTLKSASIRIL